jgi:hypothetical protein
MCLCEEARRSNLLVLAQFLSLKLLKSLNYCNLPTDLNEKYLAKNNRLLRRTSSQRHVFLYGDL